MKQGNSYYNGRISANETVNHSHFLSTRLDGYRKLDYDMKLKVCKYDAKLFLECVFDFSKQLLAKKGFISPLTSASCPPLCANFWKHRSYNETMGTTTHRQNPTSLQALSAGGWCA